jgi:replicative DNA helicase
MSQDVYAQRFDAHISNININHLNDYSNPAQNRIKEFYKQHPNANLFIKEYPPRTISCKEISSYLENLKNNGFNFDVVIIDYLNIVRPTYKTDSMFKDGLAVSEEMRALSYKFGVPVISAVQANTEGMANENIDMQNISESRGIAHTADFIGGLYQMPDDRNAGLIKMRISKNRLGGYVGKILSFKVDPATLKIEDTSTDYPDDVSELNEADKITANLANLSDDLDDL